MERSSATPCETDCSDVGTLLDAKCECQLCRGIGVRLCEISFSILMVREDLQKGFAKGICAVALVRSGPLASRSSSRVTEQLSINLKKTNHRQLTIIN